MEKRPKMIERTSWLTNEARWLMTSPYSRLFEKRYAKRKMTHAIWNKRIKSPKRVPAILRDEWII